MSYSHFTVDCAEHHGLVRDFGGPRPEIVVLCGSTRFFDTFRAENLRLTCEGKIVLSIGCDTKSDGDLFGVADVEALKADLDDLHKRKIDLADWVWVLNVGGYIGDSTRSEIAYAESLGKPIAYLVDPARAPERPAEPAADPKRATCEHAALRPRCKRDREGRCVMCCAHYHFFSED